MTRGAKQTNEVIVLYCDEMFIFLMFIFDLQRSFFCRLLSAVSLLCKLRCVASVSEKKSKKSSEFPPPFFLVFPFFLKSIIHKNILKLSTIHCDYNYFHKAWVWGYASPGDKTNGSARIEQAAHTFPAAATARSKSPVIVIVIVIDTAGAA